MSHDIFVSYSSKDKAVADAIVSALENSGLRCWVAPRDVKPGAIGVIQSSRRSMHVKPCC